MVSMNESFLDKFGGEHEDFKTLMEDWFFDEEWPMKKWERNVRTQYLKIPYRMLNTTICRLYDKENNTHFIMEWFSMDYMVVKKSQDFNWENILSFNIVNHVQDPKAMKNSGFYMSSYLIDAICSTNSFPTFSWS